MHALSHPRQILILALACASIAVFAKPDTADRCTRDNTVTADVVAIEQAYVINRFAAFVPGGMLYALRRDVVSIDSSAELKPGKVRLRSDKRPRPLVLRIHEGGCLDIKFQNLLDPLWTEEGGLPLEYDGKLPQHAVSPAGVPTSRELVVASKVSKDLPRTRAASIHVKGLEHAPISQEQCPPGYVCGGDGTNVGLPGQQGKVFNTATSAQERGSFKLGTLVAPGQRSMTRLTGVKEGTYFAYSTAAPVGGEGDGGQIGLGLFGAVNVEPAGSRWYRSQVTQETLQQATRTDASRQHPFARVDYEAERNGTPLLAILNKRNEIVHSDLNALVVLNEHADKRHCKTEVFGNSCGKSFREFTVIMHDEVHAEQAFAELADESNPLHYLKDGMGINYGVSSMGSLLVSAQPQRAVGVVAKCPECRAEEFFLSSWANGDPALILKWDKDGKKPVGAMYPDDPSNVHHSYLGDPVRFRNLHAGPKETHVFHLHAHQWVLDASDPNSTYLDSQTISPGATFSYGIEYGGSGNRNLAPGDSIFHCHLYPHFAQGMWELWRVHDAFQDGAKGVFDPVSNPRGRNLPDAEVAGGIETPALVPIPGNALAPISTAKFAGYPFYVPGEPGHRPPQPPLDFDVNDASYQAATGIEPDDAKVVNGGLRRHVITGKLIGPDGKQLLSTLKKPSGGPNDPVVAEALKKGGKAAQLIAQRVYAQNKYSVEALAREWDKVYLKPLAHSGEASEKIAMEFHEGKLADDSPVGARRQMVTSTVASQHDWKDTSAAYRTEWAATTGLQKSRSGQDPLFRVNGQPRAAGAPYANPCPPNTPERQYRTAFIQTELTVNRHGWFDPQGRIVVLENDIKDIIDPATRVRLPEPLFFRANSGECINFKSTNLMPSALNVDDFQLFTPTDTIGQHIHLVKFDVTSSDGSGNGWNYEDATFSPDEVRERIFAYRYATGDKSWKPKAHPLFLPGGDIYENRNDFKHAALYEKGRCPEQGVGQSDKEYAHELNEKHPLCGAQRTIQRWWADPILNAKGKDNTLRTVFTHDHMGPSSHQQHGLYAALVIEPANSTWVKLGDKLEAGDMDNASKPGPAGDAVRKKLLGGSDLARKPAPQIVKNGHPLATIAPRPPLQLREDGGPTSSRANIVGLNCIGDADSHPFQPASGRMSAAQSAQCKNDPNDQTRREFGIAIADFAGVYNVALEPINPETRDVSARRFGERQVALQIPRPLAISSEDPGTQLVNYRNEPLALRVADVKLDAKLGGLQYSQTKCKPGDQKCTGDMANAFATHAHKSRDLALATTSYVDWVYANSGQASGGPRNAVDMVSPVTKGLLAVRGKTQELSDVVKDVEQWRKNFNCALYSNKPEAGSGMPDANCDSRIERNEHWRVMGDPATPILPAFEGDPVQIRLIQGSQEAQHIFSMNGVKWHRMAGSKNFGYTNAQPIGISEHFEFDINVNPYAGSHTDYLYFGSSIDQLWDGMWGVMRAFGQPGSDGLFAKPVGLAKLPDAKGQDRPLLGPSGSDAARQVCTDSNADRVVFDVSALRACDLFDSCGKPGQRGIAYNTRYGIQDDHAVVYVLNSRVEKRQTSAGSVTIGSPTIAQIGNLQTLENLRKQFGAGGGRTLEPLVLRAAAGQCIDTQLRNHLPAVLDDGPVINADGSTAQLPEHRAYYNFLPMITDGFNLNQIRMSSSVGLSAPRVTQQPVNGDGSNVGLNESVLAKSEEGSNALKRQGSLVPPCQTTDLGTPREVLCKRTYIWGTTDFGQTGKPLELGALPLSSFGDAIKHPTHGLVGALVIGPEGSRVCPDPSAPFWKAGLQAHICLPNGQRYLDQVLVMQDAVSATRGGMPIPNLSGAEEPDDYGVKAINYRTEPLWARRGGDPSVGFSDRNEFDYSQVFSSELIKPAAGKPRCASGAPVTTLREHPCDPETPLIEARAGERVRLHFVHPGGHTRQQGLSLSGHAWNPYPWSKESRVFNSEKGSSIRQGTYNGFGPMMGVSLEITAGGKHQIPMDYLLQSQASFLLDGGLWGILRVLPPPPKK